MDPLTELTETGENKSATSEGKIYNSISAEISHFVIRHISARIFEVAEISHWAIYTIHNSEPSDGKIYLFQK